MNEKLMHLLMQNFHSKYDNARGDVSIYAKEIPLNVFATTKFSRLDYPCTFNP